MSFLRQKIRILASRYLETPIRWYVKYQIRTVLQKSDQLILIYSIGKVGSSSVYDSIRSAFPNSNAVFHIHSLNPLRIEEQKRYYRQSERASIPLHLIISESISHELEAFKGNVYVITLIREPISRELSSVYQDYFNFSTDKNIASELMRKVSEDKVLELTKRLPEETWFDSEIKSVFGFDVLNDPFLVNKAFGIWSNGNVKLALLRMENLNQIFSRAMSELFGVDKFVLLHSNDSADKFYSDSYKRDSRAFKLTEDQLNAILSKPFYAKFYSDKIDEVRCKWVVG